MNDPERRVTRELRRPSAYFWYLMQRGCAIAFFPCLAVSFVVIFVARQGWMSIAVGLLAFGSQAANIGGLVQRGRELQSGYTTMPWLAGEVGLRDPTDGRSLVGAGIGQPRFTSMKLARAYRSSHVEVASDTVLAFSTQVSDRPIEVNVERGALSRRGQIWVVAVAAAVAFTAVGILFGASTLSTAPRIVGVAVGVAASVALVLVEIRFLSELSHQRLSRQLNALSAVTGDGLLVPVRRTVELFGEISIPAAVPISGNLFLSIGSSDVAIWSGQRTLTKVCSVPRAEVRDVRAGRARDTRGNEKPAIIIEGETTLRLSLFARRRGRGTLLYADDAETQALAQKIRVALAT